MSKYANSKFVEKITEEETTSQAKLSSSANQAITDTNFNQVFASFTPTISEISSMTGDLSGVKLRNADLKFQNDYKFGAIDMIPYNGRNISSEPAKVGCKTAPEYGTTSNVNMSRIDGNYHTFTTCKNKAAMNNNKYFSLVKPLSTSGITNPNLYECHVGNDPLISNTDGKDNKGITSYYSYEICWSLGPSVKTFGLSSDTGDIIITGDNVSNIGAKQNAYSTSVAIYTYGNNKTYLPVDIFVSLETFIFDLKQVSIQSGFINGGHVGEDIAISAVSVVPNKNDTFIVGATQDRCMKMVKIQLGIGNSTLYPSLPNNSALYVKAVEAKYSGLYRFVKITSACFGDNYLQIAYIEVFGPDGKTNYALNKPTFSKDTYENNQALSSQAVTGKAMTKSYPNIYHSKSNCNAWWMVDLGQDIDITKIVYYNRRDCCQSRINGAIIEGISSSGEVLYKKNMNGDDIQIFDVPAQNFSDLNKLWEKGNSETLANSDSAKGHGIKGLSLRVDPVALGRGNDGYTTKQNTTLSSDAKSYKTLNNVEPSVCQIACDSDPICLGYTTYGDKLIPSGKEKDPTDIGCWKDAPTRSMIFANGNGHDKNSCQKKAQQREHKYFGLQYYGECWTTNDDTATGFSRWNKDNNRPCPDRGIDWQNHVYRREFENTNVTNCNFYSDGISGSTTSTPGSNVITRTTTSFPVNNTTLNLTNNAIKLDLSQCTGNSCRFVLQLGNDGNITLFKVSSAGFTSSSTPSGTVVWNLFQSDPTVLNKIKNIPSITQQEWKNTISSDMLVAGENIPTNKPHIISKNGQFKLEINGGYLQLKTAVYGCFSKNYNYTSLPLYTEAVVNKPQYYYVYQTDLSHPKVGNVYYRTSGPNGTAAKQIERTNPILVPQDKYMTLNGYKPANDVNPIATADNNMDNCKNSCNSNPNCKYLYFTKDNKCYLGNQLQPAYVPDPEYYDTNTDNSPPPGSQTNTTDPNYKLALRSLKMDIPDLKSSNNLKKEVIQPTVFEYKNFKPEYYGPNIANINDVGYSSTPIGKAFISRFDTTLNQTGSQTESPAATTQTIYRTSNYASPMPGPNQGFRNIEGFDSHGWSDPGEKCGSQPGFPGCFYGIKDGQINPLKKISQDYSNKLNKISSMYRDLSNNIDNYNLLRNNMINNSKYDFNGDQKIVFSGNTDLLTEMKNDSKKIALQTNNLYIAGSILTTTLLVSAIYLGR